MMNEQFFSPGWDEHRVKQLIAHYEAASEGKQIVEDEAKARELRGQTVIDICNGALEATRPSIPPTLYQDVSDYVNRFNECGVGMEMLVDQIIELEIKILLAQFLYIQNAMASMGLEETNRIAYLRNHNVTLSKTP
jgi:hypothetical protein